MLICLDVQDEMQIVPIEMSEDPPGITPELSTDCSIRDIEMRDVSKNLNLSQPISQSRNKNLSLVLMFYILF